MLRFYQRNWLCKLSPLRDSKALAPRQGEERVLILRVKEDKSLAVGRHSHKLPKKS